MINKIHIWLVVIVIGFVTTIHGQRYTIRNGIGLQGGLTQFDILTDNFNIKSNSGFLGGLSASVDIPHKWYNLSYNISFSENNFNIRAFQDGSLEEAYIEYKLLTAQVSFLLHVKLIENYLTLDAGPMLQYNGELDLKDSSSSDFIIAGYQSLKAQDITDISRFNVNGAVGLTVGLGRFALRAQYIYGFTNMLNRLNDQDLNVDNNTQKFKGNQSMLVFTALIIL